MLAKFDPCQIDSEMKNFRLPLSRFCIKKPWLSTQ